MTTTVVTTKGQIVIPSVIRKHMKLRKGTRLRVLEERNRIILHPLTKDYFSELAGILKTKGKLTKRLLNERLKDKERENRRR